MKTKLKRVWVYFALTLVFIFSAVIYRVLKIKCFLNNTRNSCFSDHPKTNCAVSQKRLDPKEFCPLIKDIVDSSLAFFKLDCQKDMCFIVWDLETGEDINLTHFLRDTEEKNFQSFLRRFKNYQLAHKKAEQLFQSLSKERLDYGTLSFNQSGPAACDSRIFSIGGLPPEESEAIAGYMAMKFSLSYASSFSLNYLLLYNKKFQELDKYFVSQGESPYSQNSFIVTF